MRPVLVGLVGEFISEHEEASMKSTTVKFILSAIALAVVLAPAADAAKRKPQAAVVAPSNPHRDMYGVPIGPNSVVFANRVIGQDPDPNIRAAILRDVGKIFGGGDR